MLDAALCGDAFRGPSWETWRIIARLYDGDSELLTGEQQAIARELLGRAQLPTEAPRELFVGAGRRSGKTRFDALLAVHAAAEDYTVRLKPDGTPLLAPGEWATVSCHCVDKRQARTWFGYCEGLIEGSALLGSEVSNKTAEAIEFSHRTRIEVHTSSFRAIRGYSIALAVIDEAAYLRDESSATPDLELYRALKPALATLNGRLVVTSSLHRKTGLMWKMHRENFGAAVA